MKVGLILLLLAAVTFIYAFEERLFIQPLEDGKRVFHFQFTQKAQLGSDSGSHVGGFPRGIVQLIEEFDIKELSVSMTQGRWAYHRWGSIPFIVSVPLTGTQVWTIMNASDSNGRWKKLTNRLSGIFCASINFMDDSITARKLETYRNEWISNSTLVYDSFHSHLPREIVCTENLTPFLKLIPSKGQSGIAALLHGEHIFDSVFHSLQTKIKVTCSDSNCSSQEIILHQSVTTVLHEDYERDIFSEDEMSFQRLLGRQLKDNSPITQVSEIILAAPKAFIKSIEILPDMSVYASKIDYPQVQYTIINVKKLPIQFPLDLKFKCLRSNSDKLGTPSPILLGRHFTGFGQERGGVRVKIVNNHNITIKAIYLEVLPWYMRFFFHTLVDGTRKSLLAKNGLVEKVFYSPAKDRSRPTVLELNLSIPPKTTFEFSYQFEKGSLKYTEYPPDPNRGFDISGATLTYWAPRQSLNQNFEWYSGLVGRKDVKESSPLVRFQTSSETMLLVLPLPDFSMPYNVITFTCTIFALFFGSIFNLYTRKFMTKEEYDEKSFAGKVRARVKALKSKLARKVGRKGERGEGESKLVDEKDAGKEIGTEINS